MRPNADDPHLAPNTMQSATGAVLDARRRPGTSGEALIDDGKNVRLALRGVARARGTSDRT